MRNRGNRDWLKATGGLAVCAGAALTFAACAGGSAANPGTSGAPGSIGPGDDTGSDGGIPGFPIGTSPPTGMDAGGGGNHPTYGPTTSQAVAPPPLSGGTLAVSADGSQAFASDPDRDALYLINVTSASSRTVALQAGDEPGRVVLDGAGKVHVVLRGAGAIATIDPASATIVSRTAVCARPRGIVYASAQDSILVACGGGQLITLPAAGGAPTRTVTLEPDLRDVVMVGANPVVSSFRTADLMQIAPDGTIAQRFTQPSFGDTPSVAWRMIPTSDGVAVALQLATPNAVAPVPGGYGSGGCMGSVTNPAVSAWSSTGTWKSLTELAGALPVDVSLSPDQSTYAVVVPGEWRMPGSLQLLISPVNTGVMGGFPGTSGPVDPPPAPNDAPTPPSPADAGGVATSDDAGFPIEEDAGGISGCGENAVPISGQATAVAYLPSGGILVQTREPATLQFVNSSMLMVTQTIPLSTVSRDDTGHEVFHSDQGGGIACASCHPEGGEDGRVWQFTDVGARRTPSALGTLAGTAPYHWDGTELDLPSLYHGSLERMNGVDLESDQVTAFSTWISALPAPTPLPTDADAVARGQALFQNDGSCVSCHSGPKFTNNQTVDVGTGEPMQVPPLVGVGWRAPYLHDGCGSTLIDAIGACGHASTHGTTTGFTSAQLSDLATYLQSL